MGGGNLQHRQIGPGIGADDDGWVNVMIVGGDPDILVARYDMIVGDDIAVGIDDESGADRAIDRLEHGGEFFRIDAIGSEGIIRFDMGVRGGNRNDRRSVSALRDFFELLLEIGDVKVVRDLNVFCGALRAAPGLNASGSWKSGAELTAEQEASNPAAQISAAVTRLVRFTNTLHS